MGKEKEDQEKFLLEKSGLLSVIDLKLLTTLNLPECNLSRLPEELPRIVPNLSILFCPKNQFKELPAIIGECPELQMVSFKDNGMETIHPEALQPQMRWLILTGNKITSIPESIGRCKRLQKLMLSGNSLTVLPKAISELTNLELIRLACNNIQDPPMDLLRLPNLRWVALSRNPFLHEVLAKRPEESLESLDDPTLEDTNWPILGKGAGGVTRKVTWRGDMDVAVKTFVGELSSDGSPLDEKAISVAASSLQHESLIQLLGETHATGSLVMEFLDGFKALADPPSMESCSRDVYLYDHAATLTPNFAWKIARNLFHAILKLHVEKGICHGDFYGHNILISPQTESVKLSDFGAAFFYDVHSDYGKLLQQVELRAYSVLVEEMFALIQDQADEGDRAQWKELVADSFEATSFEGLLKHFT